MVNTAGPCTETFESTDPDAIEQFFIDAYGTRVRIRSDGRCRLLRHRRTDAGTFAVEIVEHSANRVLTVEPLPTLAITQTSSARIARSCRRVENRYDVGELFLMSHLGEPYTCRWSPGEVAHCLLDPALLARVAATAPSRRPGPIRFTSLDPISPAAAAHWSATQSYIARLLANPDAATPLVLAAASQLLAAATLATFPNTALADPTAGDRRDASPATVRRAVAYIDSHAAQDIAVADIAAAANVTVRAVQLAFRRHLDTTPTAYLRRVRLEQVHRALIDADPTTTTVSALAARWGFANHSRFTATYRSTYGVAPSTTLRGA
ncbi:helix-turn-helix transcriptional regulator [Actinoplanes sp. NPDC049548]|uniref:helix-turn-helix transcriptional regulator n=1 Tax=Actinoplanes sp. NPDC049548 TaxID=3155152 RepID=UPI0034205D6B